MLNHIIVRAFSLVSLLLLGACVTSFRDTDPEALPRVRILHDGEQIAHSDFKKGAGGGLACPSGYVRSDDVVAVVPGFPAELTVEIVDRWGVRTAEVVVFGGTIMDTDRQVEVRSSVLDNQRVEIARRDFDWLHSRGVKSMTVEVLPLVGSNEAGSGTVKVMARAFDRAGLEDRTSTPVLGTLGTLCGPW